VHAKKIKEGKKLNEGNIKSNEKVTSKNSTMFLPHLQKCRKESIKNT